MQEHATALADAVDAALPGWVERSVARRMAEAGRSEPEVAAAAAAAGRRAQREVGPRVRKLLHADIDEQRTTPLSLLREAVRYPTEVLQAAGVQPVERDEMQERLFPHDVYDLAPASFADVHPDLAEPGLAWGAAKAWNHRRRHGASQS
ncbi:MAG TPA: hypothetical protein VHH09_07445 [Acidimicrobiales bacterium]|nr:hypothetical protein [Acidimicrobiales bacterium]